MMPVATLGPWLVTGQGELQRTGRPRPRARRPLFDPATGRPTAPAGRCRSTWLSAELRVGDARRRGDGRRVDQHPGRGRIDGDREREDHARSRPAASTSSPARPPEPGRRADCRRPGPGRSSSPPATGRPAGVGHRRRRRVARSGVGDRDQVDRRAFPGTAWVDAVGLVHREVGDRRQHVDVGVAARRRVGGARRHADRHGVEQAGRRRGRLSRARCKVTDAADRQVDDVGDIRSRRARRSAPVPTRESTAIASSCSPTRVDVPPVRRDSPAPGRRRVRRRRRRRSAPPAARPAGRSRRRAGRLRPRRRCSSSAYRNRPSGVIARPRDAVEAGRPRPARSSLGRGRRARRSRCRDSKMAIASSARPAA